MICKQVYNPLVRDIDHCYVLLSGTITINAQVFMHIPVMLNNYWCVFNDFSVSRSDRNIFWNRTM